MLHKLKALTVAGLRTPGRYGDGGSLFLTIGKAGGKSWIFLYRDRASGRLREMGLGSFDAVTLEHARELAASARALLASGRDPITEKHAQREAAKETARVELATRTTFAEFLESDFLPGKLAGYRNAKHRWQYEHTLTVDAASLGPLPVSKIRAEDVRACLAPMWQERNETAQRLRGRLEKAFDLAKAKGLRDGDNPAAMKGNLEHLLPNVKRAETHMAALPFKDAPAFMTDLRKLDSTSALALEFCILTAARTAEVIGATWAEIDLEESVWTVPAGRMKMEREHRVPLCARAVAILESIKRAKATDLIFRNGRHGLSNMAMLQCLRGVRPGFTVHGFRSSFRDWAGDVSTFPRDVIEFALAHGLKDKVEAAYRRGHALEKRRELMDAWAGYLSAKPANVVTLRKRKA
jgi:integrase